jgi:mannose-6-phosphate isomerase-like protein (cupin superfamily)
MATCKSSKLSIPDCIPKITKYWSPKLVASINNSYDVKVAKLSGEFVWHSHQDTDELFYIISGRVVIQLNEPGRDSGLDDVTLNEGDIFVVPKGIRHCPTTIDGKEAVVLLMEPSGVINTGDAGHVDGRSNAVEDIRSVN